MLQHVHGAFTLRALGALSRIHLPGRTDAAHLDLFRAMSLSSNTSPTHHTTWCETAGVDPARVATVWVENLSGLCRLLGRVNPCGSCATKVVGRNLSIWAEHELAAMRGGVLFIFTAHIVALDPHARRDEREAARVEWRWGDDQPELDLAAPGGDPSGIDPSGITTPLYRDHVCDPPQPPEGGEGDLERFIESCIPETEGYPRRRLSDAERVILGELVEEHGVEAARSTARDVCPGKLYPVQHLGKALTRAAVEAAAGVERQPQAHAGDASQWRAQPSAEAQRAVTGWGRRRGRAGASGWAEVGRRDPAAAPSAPLTDAEVQAIEADAARALSVDVFDDAWTGVQRAEIDRDREAPDYDCDKRTRASRALGRLVEFTRRSA